MGTVLGIEDHEVFRAGLQKVLLSTPVVDEVLHADSGVEGLRTVRTTEVDLVLLDLGLPDSDGLEILKHLQAEKPDIPVIIVSAQPESLYAVRALRAGARGYLCKSQGAEDLVLAVTRVLEGQRYLTPTVAEFLADELAAPVSRPAQERLSDRELQASPPAT